MCDPPLTNIRCTIKVSCEREEDPKLSYHIFFHLPVCLQSILAELTNTDKAHSFYCSEEIFKGKLTSWESAKPLIMWVTEVWFWVTL